ncbi:kinase-like protein [Rhizophagus irregularis]|nr:kinase-like protein [Rhizophagus irregularis]
MSNNAEFNSNSNYWNKWIENAISKRLIKYYEFEQFYNIEEIGASGFGKRYAIKSFFNINDATVKAIVREIQLQREVDFHENVIRFYGVTTSIRENQKKEYSLVIEYAENGTLQKYLKENFENLSWDNKFDLAFQLVYAVSCLHDEGIVHRDLHSNNVLVHQIIIKLADFGLSKRIEEISNSQSKVFGLIPYVDPKSFDSSTTEFYLLNKKSDVYSIGVLLWEISSCRPPFHGRQYDAGLALNILQGIRETPTHDTPEEYIKIYTDCWNIEPDNRPIINQVVNELKVLITKENIIIKDFRLYNDTNNVQSSNNHQLPNLNVKISKNTNSLHGELSQVIQNFDMIDMTNTKEIESSISSINQFGDNFNIIVNDMFNFFYDDEEVAEQKVLSYLNEQNITLQEINDLLLINQNNSNSIYLLGKFNNLGIGISVNEQKAFELYQKAADLGNKEYSLVIEYAENGKPYDVGLALGILQGLRETPIHDTPEEYIRIYTDCWNIEPDNRPTINQVVDELKQPTLNVKISENIVSLHGDLFQVIQNFNMTNIDDVETSISSNNDNNKDIQSSTNQQPILNVTISENIDSLHGDLSQVIQNFNMMMNTDDIETSISSNNISENNFNIHDITLHEINNLSNQDNSNPIVLLGIISYLGINTNVDKKKAFVLYQKVADLGNSFGINNLGHCYEIGIGIDIDKKKALALYQKAAYLGNSFGVNNLGHYYENGIGNIKSAFELFQKAADLGNSLGINNLGRCYENGIGTDIDKEKALELYRKAAD